MSLAPGTALERRHDAIRAALATHRADAFIITALPNILYLTNFTGSAAIVVLTASRLLFLTDSRYVTVMNEARGRADECPGLELVTVEGSFDATLVDVLVGQDWNRVAFEAANLTVARHTWLATRLAASGSAPVDLIPTEGVVERPRQIEGRVRNHHTSRGRPAFVARCRAGPERGETRAHGARGRDGD